MYNHQTILVSHHGEECTCTCVDADAESADAEDEMASNEHSTSTEQEQEIHHFNILGDTLMDVSTNSCPLDAVASRAFTSAKAGRCSAFMEKML